MIQLTLDAKTQVVSSVFIKITNTMSTINIMNIINNINI